jgi:hypothetical protein
MKTFRKHLQFPLNVVREQPYQFAVWWIVANVFGLSGLLLPVLFNLSRGKSSCDIWVSALRAGTFYSFGVVLLAEGIAATAVAVKSGTSLVSAGLRGLVSVLAFGLALIQVAFLAMQTMVTDGSIPSGAFTASLTALTILCASYLYCFRFVSWEKGVREWLKKEEQDVEKLKKSAAGENKDDEGVKL